MKTSKTAQLVDSVTAKNHSVAAASDRVFGSDFAMRRRNLVAEAKVLRVLAKLGRINLGRVLSRTALRSLPCAEALSRLAEKGLITVRRYPETGYLGPLVDLMPDVAALNRARIIIAETAGPTTLRGDVKAYENIQARIDALEVGHEPGAPH